MKKFLFAGVAVFALLSCSTKDRYAVDRYYGVQQQDSVLASIVNYIYTAPPYTMMQDRFKPEHRSFYVGLAPSFSINKYFIAEDGTNYFLVIRPGPTTEQQRAVGGYFRINKNYQLTGFREVFVTPLLADGELKERAGFLFDEMAKGEIEKSLKMNLFVQWPNEASVYDTLTYEWKLKEAL